VLPPGQPCRALWWRSRKVDATGLPGALRCVRVLHHDGLESEWGGCCGCSQHRTSKSVGTHQACVPGPGRQGPYVLLLWLCS
jgi:hypothetical protein